MQSVDTLLDLSKYTVLVSGAGGNIGAAIADRLAQAGARVVAHFRSNDARIAGLLERHGERLLSVQADLTVEADVDHLFEVVDGVQWQINALVNNAADQSIAPLASLSMTEWQQMMAANVEAALRLSQRLLPTLAAAGIVNISSIEGIDPAPGHGHYAASKAALNMLTRALALEAAPLHVRVNTVSPGLIHRDGIEQDWPEGVARWQERAPLTRLGDPVDVADAVLFLLSDAARWISGCNLLVDGGMSAQGRW